MRTLKKKEKNEKASFRFVLSQLSFPKSFLPTTSFSYMTVEERKKGVLCERNNRFHARRMQIPLFLGVKLICFKRENFRKLFKSKQVSVAMALQVKTLNAAPALSFKRAIRITILR